MKIQKYLTLCSAVGDYNKGIKLSLDELILHIFSSGCVELCKGWLKNEDE